MAAATGRQPLVTSVAIKRPLSVGFKLVLLFLSLLTIAAGIMAWHSEQEHKRARSSLRAVDASLARVSGELEAMRLRESLRDTQLKQQQAVISTLIADGPALRQRWLTDRIDAAVTVAEQALVLRHDVIAARRALTDAEALLSEHTVANLAPLHRAMQQDIRALAALEPIDTRALYQRLSAVQLSLEQLNATARQTVAVPTAVPITQQPVSLWQQGLAKFRELIIIRQHDEPLVPIVDDTQLSLLRSQLDAQIMQAQAALLRGDGAIYREALASASRRIQTRLASLSAAQTAPLRDELADLQAQSVTLDAPILVSRAALSALPTLGGEQ